MSCPQARGLCGLLLVAAVSVVAGEARAETTFTVDYRAADVCPDRGAFIHEIQRRSRIAKPVGKAEQPDVVFLVELRLDKGKRSATGKLVTTQGVKTTERIINGKTCPEVATGLALIAALTVDPNAELTPAPEPLALPPDVAGPPILTTQPALIDGPAPLLPSLPPPAPRPGKIPPPGDLALLALPLPVWPVPRDTPAAAEPGLEGGAFAHFVVNVGAGPTPLVGIAGGAELRDVSDTLGWALRAELSYATVTEVTVTQGVDSRYRMLRGVVSGCVPTWAATGWFRLAPCGSFGGGAVWGELVKVFETKEQSVEATSPWLEVGAAARAALAPLPWLAFEVQAGPTFPLVSGLFKNLRGNVFEPSPVNFDLGVGASAAF